jgi:hypothetical protein
LTGVPFDEFEERLLRPSERVIIADEDLTGISYRARHRVIANIVTEYQLPNAVDRLSVYEAILELLDLGFEEDVLAYRKISRNRELMNSLGLYDLKTRFYEACRRVDETDPIVAQHWAILAMEQSRFPLAERLLGEAQRLVACQSSNEG